MNASAGVLTARLFCCLASLPTLLCGVALSQDPRHTPKRFDRAVVLYDNQTLSGKNGCCSGCIVAYKSACYLVAAKHCTTQFTNKCEIGVLGKDRDVFWVALETLSPDKKIKWIHQNESQLSIAKLDLTDKSDASQALQAVAIPFESITVESVERGRSVDIVGFPRVMILRPDRITEPILCRSSFASAPFVGSKAWRSGVVILAMPPAGEGFSGGPVFVAEDDPFKVSLVGIYNASLLDDIGRMAGFITPASVLAEFISSSHE